MGIDGAIMDRSDPAQAVINTIGVGDLEATMEAVRNAGGKADGDIDDIRSWSLHLRHRYGRQPLRHSGTAARG